MNPPRAIRPRQGFTLVELLLAVALSALVAAILAMLLRGLLMAGDGQAARLRGPFGARSAIRTLSREVSCAFHPPVQDLVPLTLSTSTEPGKPQVRLAFYAPALPPSPAYPGAYDIHQVAYEVHALGSGRRELRRIASPCSGPFTNRLTTNRIFAGPFTLAIAAVSNDTPHAEWPPPGETQPALPASLLLSLQWKDQPDPFETEVLIQTAHGIRSPVERPDAPAGSDAPAADY